MRTLAIIIVLLIAGCSGSSEPPASSTRSPSAAAPASVDVSAGVAPAQAVLMPGTSAGVRLQSACSGKLLDVAGASTANGARLLLWEDNGGANQRFVLREQPGGQVALIAAHSDKALDATERGVSDGTPLQQWDFGAQSNQLWRVIDNGDGTQTFIGAASGKALDVQGAGTRDGTPVQLWTPNGTCAQRWRVLDDDTRSRVAYAGTDEVIANPERGPIILWQPSASNGAGGNAEPLDTPGVLDYFQRERQRTGATTVRVVYNLAAYRQQALPAAFLDRIARDFAAARGAGFKLVPYFSYGWVLDQQQQAAVDASVDRTIAHIEQLAPLLAREGDTLALMFGGFIGAWGEWHSSSSGNVTADGGINDNSRRIFAALMQALPADRMLALRYASHKRALLGTAPLAPAQAFGALDRARVGFHDESFLQQKWGSEQTFDWYPGYISAEGPFVPSVEAFDSATRNTNLSCSELHSALASRRSDFINDVDGMALVQAGCAAEVRRRIGYRYRLIDSQLATRARPGQALTLSLTIANDGWGALFNPRRPQVLLQERTTRQVVRIDASIDLRAALPAPAATRTLDVALQLPTALASGSYDVLLALPDASPRLAAQSRYAVRLANDGLWRADLGANALMRSLDIGP